MFRGSSYSDLQSRQIRLFRVRDEQVSRHRFIFDERKEVFLFSVLLQVEQCEINQISVATLDRLCQRKLVLLHGHQERNLIGSERLVLEQLNRERKEGGGKERKQKQKKENHRGQIKKKEKEKEKKKKKKTKKEKNTKKRVQ